MAKQLNVSLNIVANTEQAKREMKALSDQLNKIGNTSFMDKGAGKEYEKGKLTLSDLRDLALKSGEPKAISGKQELLEQLINMYLE